MEPEQLVLFYETDGRLAGSCKANPLLRCGVLWLESSFVLPRFNDDYRANQTR